MGCALYYPIGPCLSFPLGVPQEAHLYGVRCRCPCSLASVLTSRGGERTKIQKVSRSRNSGSCSSTLPRWELGATLSCHFAPLARCWLWRPFRAGGFALCPGFLGCMGHISPCSVGLCCLPDAPLLSCFLTAAAEIRFNYGLS